MLDYINQLLHYIIDNWFLFLGQFLSPQFLFNPLFIFLVFVPISISILFLAVKIIRKFIWGAK